MKTWLITGISRGLGLSLARAALARGDRVIGTVREGAPPIEAAPDQLHVLTLDMRDRDAVSEAVRQAFAIAGTIDVVVNNAGFGLVGAVGEASREEIASVFDVNFFGPLELIQAALPFLRAQGSGHIINITSIAGRAPGMGAGIYAAAKHALEGLSKALAQEVAPQGIKVTTVAPGVFRTDFFTDHSIRTSSAQTDAWTDSVDKMRFAYKSASGRQPGDPDKAAQAMLTLVDAENPPVHLLLGSDALKRDRAKIAETLAEMDQWEAITTSTDFPRDPA